MREPIKPRDDARYIAPENIAGGFGDGRINPGATATVATPHFANCRNCGRSFQAPPSSRIVTCSKACSRRRKIGTHVGKPHRWSDDARVRLAAKGQTPNLCLGTEAARNSPKAGPYETNQEAKRWWIVAPNGQEYEVVNLAKWLRDNADLLPDGRADLAHAGLRQVQRSMQGKTKRTVSAWKGWTLQRESEPK